MRRPLLAFVAPSLRARLWLLVAAVVVPGTLLAVWLIVQTYRNDRAAIERQLFATSRAYSALIDSELRARLAMLRGLGMSRALAADDFGTFRTLALRVRLPEGESIRLLDADGRQLVNTAEAADAALPPVPIAGEFAQAIAQGRPYISNLLGTPAEHTVWVAIGVLLGGGRQGMLCVTLTSEALARLPQEQRMQGGVVLTVIDREQTVLARSRRGDRFVGRKATNDVRTALHQKTSGVIDSVTLDGHPSVLAFHVSPETGWGMLLAGHKSELLQPALRMMVTALGVTGLVVVGVLLLAAWIGRATGWIVSRLVADTEALARGSPVAARQTGVKEADVVSRALAATSRELEARQAALLQARDAALQASRAKDEFLASLSHELRTPLNPVLLLASDAAVDPQYPDPVRELFATIERNVLQEVRLIDDLLDVTRIVAGKLALRLEPLEIDTAVREAVEIVRPWAAQKLLNVQTNWGGEGVRVLADSVRLQQVLTNVLGNAVKFTPQRGLLRADTRVDEGGRGITIEITDSGIGMNTDELARVFDRFAQGDHARNGGHSRYGGLGLGLAISKGLVQALGGKIEATSAGPGRGSTFRLWFPRLTSDAIPAAPSARSSQS